MRWLAVKSTTEFGVWPYVVRVESARTNYVISIYEE